MASLGFLCLSSNVKTSVAILEICSRYSLCLVEVPVWKSAAPVSIDLLRGMSSCESLMAGSIVSLEIIFGDQPCSTRASQSSPDTVAKTPETLLLKLLQPQINPSIPLTLPFPDINCLRQDAGLLEMCQTCSAGCGTKTRLLYCHWIVRSNG